MKDELDIYLVRDVGTGELAEFGVGPEPWIRQRFAACIETIQRQLHVVVQHRRSVDPVTGENMPGE